MKTLTEYEASDIDLKDPVHSFLMSSILIGVLSMMGAAAKRDEPPENTEESMKKTIASILNMASKQGISITKTEVPAIFTEGMR